MTSDTQDLASEEIGQISSFAFVMLIFADFIICLTIFPIIREVRSLTGYREIFKFKMC